MSQLKRIGIFSSFKVMGVLYAMVGLVAGALLSLLSLAGFAAGGRQGFVGMLFGAAAIIIMPILYGILGAISGAIGALIYNLVARITGGLEVELG